MFRTKAAEVYRFGPFLLDIHDRILLRDGHRLCLTPKVVDTLFLLVERAGDVVSKDDLIQGVWPGVTVVESGLTRNLSVLRRVLEDGVPKGSILETVPRRGYRLLLAVSKEPVRPAGSWHDWMRGVLETLRHLLLLRPIGATK